MLSNLSVCRRPAGERAARNLARRPRPLEIEAANPPIDVENLADKIQPGQTRDSIVAGSISVERHAARRDLRVVVPARAGDRQRPRDQRMHQAPAIVARQVRQAWSPIDRERREQGGRDRRRHVGRQRRSAPTCVGLAPAARASTRVHVVERRPG